MIFEELIAQQDDGRFSHWRYLKDIKPQNEKTCLPGVRPGLSQTRLYGHWRGLEA